MTLRLRTLALPALIALASPAAFAQADVSAQARVGSESVTHDRTARDDLRDRTCLRQTGSRVHMRTVARAADAGTDTRAASRRDCLAVNGRVYSRDDLDRTGRIDIADALRALDPSIR